MKITQKMIQEGWTQNEDGVWVAPSEATRKALRERVNLVEVHQEVGSDDRRDDSSLGPGWEKVPVPDKGAQVAAFIRAGLSTKEAELAANPSKLFRGR